MESKEIQNPQFILVMGGVASGKSYIINQNYKNGYVHIDAGEIFIALSEGKYYDFPSVLEEEMNYLGLELTERALNQKKNIIIEIIGDNEIEVSQLIDKLTKVGYNVDVQFIQCDIEIALERNENRSDDNISAFYTQPYHFKWLNEAIARLATN